MEVHPRTHQEALHGSNFLLPVLKHPSCTQARMCTRFAMAACTGLQLFFLSPQMNPFLVTKYLVDTIFQLTEVREA